MSQSRFVLAVVTFWALCGLERSLHPHSASLPLRSLNHVLRFLERLEFPLLGVLHEREALNTLRQQRPEGQNRAGKRLPIFKTKHIIHLI